MGLCLIFTGVHMEKQRVKIYTDGSCLSNPGPGGWAAILTYGDVEKVISGGEEHTTNNRMELLAVINALEALKRSCIVTVISDSQYVMNGMSKGWAKGWLARGGKKSDGKPALNMELWERLIEAAECHEITYEWIRGHAGHPYNERCDLIAKGEAEKFKE